VEATIFPATEAKEIITPPSATTIPSAAEAKATTMPLLAAEAKAIKIPPAATTPTAKATLFSAELEAKAILS
jgi:hypothetical protein